MACRVALVAALPSTCSAISFLHTRSSRSARRVLLGDVGLLDRESIEDELMPAARDDCKGAEEGTACYKSVTWLRQEGFSSHPEWYQGYSSESRFEEVQDMLYGLGKANCPKPCLGPSPVALFKSEPTFDCRDTIKGDACYASVTFLKEVGLELHPDWFPGLRADSSTSSIQAELHRRGKADCPLPCVLTDEDKANALQEMKEAQRDKDVANLARVTEELKKVDCSDAQPGTQCYNDVTYGMAEGIKNYPFMYEALTETSTFHEVQEHMYLHGRSFCGRPCPEKQLDLELLAKHPEEFREKKRVQDMSMKELNDYFNGDWDGYVAREFRAQDYQVGQYKKSKYGASTTITPEEAMALPIVGDEEIVSQAPEEVGNASDVEAKMANTSDIAAEMANTSDVDAEMANASTQDSDLNFSDAMAPPQNDSDPVSEPALNVTEEVAPASATASTETAEEDEASLPKEEAIPETYQVLTVRMCLKKLHEEVTPENFGDLRKECESIMEEVYDGGEAHEALSKEAMSYFIWAQRRVEQIRDERKAKEAQTATSAQDVVNVVDEPTPLAQDVANVVDEPTPLVEPDGEGEATKANSTAVETQPRVETLEEMEQRIRKDLLGEMQQTTPFAPQRETEEEMRQRLRAEIAREIMTSKGEHM